MTDQPRDSVLIEAALDSARVVDDFVRSLAELAGGEIGGGRDVTRNWTQRVLGKVIHGERQVAQGMAGAYGSEQLRKAAGAADELVADVERLRLSSAEALRQAVDAVADLGVVDMPIRLRAADPFALTDVHRQLARVIGALNEARTRIVLAEMRPEPPGKSPE